MKDFSYLQAFSPNVLKGAQMILEKGFTIEDINEFLGRPRVPTVPQKALRGISQSRLVKPCCGGSKVDKQVRAFREKQKRLRVERLKEVV